MAGGAPIQISTKIINIEKIRKLFLWVAKFKMVSDKKPQTFVKQNHLKNCPRDKIEKMID